MSFLDKVREDAERETAEVLEAGAEIASLLSRLQELLKGSADLAKRAQDVISIREAVGLGVPDELRTLASQPALADAPVKGVTQVVPEKPVVPVSERVQGEWAGVEAPATTPVVKQERKPEKVPAELRRFPASRGRHALSVRVNTARVQKRILEALPGTSLEVSEALGSTKQQVAKHLNDMQEHGVVMFAGVNRRHAPVYLEAPEKTKGLKKLVGALAEMPAALSGQTKLASQHVVAVEQLLVLDAITQHGQTVVAPEVPPLLNGLDIPQARAKDILDALAEQGKFLRKTGKSRSQRGTHNKPGLEFAATGVTPESMREVADHYKALRASVFRVKADPSVPPSQAHPPEAVTAGTVVKPDSSGNDEGKSAGPVRFVEQSERQKRLRRSRDWACTQLETDFTDAKLAAAVGISTTEAREDLDELRKQHPDMFSVRALKGGVVLYRYEPPREPGPAAVLDMQRARERSAAERANKGVSGPVPGTGVKASDFTRDRMLQPVIAKCLKVLGVDKVQKTAGNHIAIITPKEGRILVSSTPGSSKSVRDSQSRLRRAGVAV